MPAQYKIKKATNGQFYFILTAENNEPILNSEHYPFKQSALNGIQAVRINSPFDSRFQRLRSRDLKYYFVLKSANGEIIGTSETYDAQSSVENGVTAVKRVGPSAPVDDQT